MCWTADRLAKRGLPHPEKCAMCDQEETVQHILTDCAFARQLWYSILTPVGLDHTVPRRSDNCFADWRKANVKVCKAQEKGSTVL